MKYKKYLLYIMLLSALFFAACGNGTVGSNGTESTQGIEENLETETEFVIEIVDSEDILRKTWSEYTNEDRFKIMGGHFTSPVVGLPAKYDLTQTTDLVQMYCFPEAQLETIDDAATMIDLYNAGRFTAGVYHVASAESAADVVEGIKNQVPANEWHGEKPEKLCIMKIDEQYIVSVYGREELVDQFQQKMKSVYKKMVEVVAEEKLF